MHFLFGLSLHRTTNLRSATVCFGRGQKCFSVQEKEMKIRRASFHFLDYDIQKTVKWTRFCKETSSHESEIQCHTETEPDFLLVKNVHESFTDREKQQKKMSHFKKIATSCRIKAPHHAKSSDRDVARSWDLSRICRSSLCALVSYTQDTHKTSAHLCYLSSLLP